MADKTPKDTSHKDAGPAQKESERVSQPEATRQAASDGTPRTSESVTNTGESKTKTVPYGGGNYNDPGPNVNSPSIHDLATQMVEERMGPDARNNPTFKDQVKDTERQIRENAEATKGM